MNKNNVIKWTILTGLWAVLLVPFFVANNMFFPFITGKNFAFRIIVEIIFALWVYLAFIDAKYRPKFSWVTVSVGAFVIIMALADIFAVNPLKAIWSNYERMDGFITLLHLIMYLFVFAAVMKTEKIWSWFFRSSLIASIIMIFPVLNEWISTHATRVSVTLGNPIYVAVYFMFNFFFALILLYKDVIAKTENNPKPLKAICSDWLTYAYSIAAIICFFGIWRTSTRGVILGLLGGLVVASIIIAIFEKKNKLLKKSSIGVLIAIVVLVGGFLSIKNTKFVKNNVTLERFAEISWNDVAGQGQARQYVWPMAIKGFLEKPILGWGQEGFNNVFNKYYDVRMYNQEQWFDRAHDTPLDVLVAGGALGLIAYLSIFIAALFVILKKKNNFNVIEAGLIIGLLSAYFAQNLFVFDNLVSYIFFYVVLAYLYSRDTNEETKDDRKITDDVANYVVTPILVVIFGAMLWYCNIMPINANLNLINAMQAGRQSAQASLDSYKQVFAANTFGNSEAREQIVSVIPQVLSSSKVDAGVSKDFVDLAYTQMQEQIKQTPDDARYQFFMGVFLDNINQYQLALPYLQKALALSPNKLTMMFELAKCYSYLGQKNIALEINKKAYDLVPEYTDAQMNYAASLILNGNETLAKQVIGTTTVSNEIVVRSYLLLAEDFSQKGDKNSAIGEIKKAINLAPAFQVQGQKIIQGIQDGSLK